MILSQNDVITRFQQLLAGVLLFLLLFEATFRIPFLLDTRAYALPEHEDIVSIIVDKTLYPQIENEVKDYASRVQQKLPGTRALIFPLDRDTHPYVINQLNSRLYFSGEAGKPDHITQKLVGTVLVGDMALPVVTKDGKDFISIFPYIDFDEPHFVYDLATSGFEYQNVSRDDEDPEVWHSVIHPNTGTVSEDVQKLKEFFAKTQEFDAKTGRYEHVFEDPQVFYFDSLREDRATSPGIWEVYSQLYLPYMEDIVYHRFSRNFARFIYEEYLDIMESDGNHVAQSFQDWEPDGDRSKHLESAPDVATRDIVGELLNRFLDVVNSKYLGDVRRYVKNTGRYYEGRSDVRVDLVPELISKKDAVVASTLYQLNTTLEEYLNDFIETNISRDIALLLKRELTKTISQSTTYQEDGETRTRTVSNSYPFTYENYYFGTNARDITSANQCNITRGSKYREGEPYVVENNKTYNPFSVQPDSEVLINPPYGGTSCFGAGGEIYTRTLWGRNSGIHAGPDQFVEEKYYEHFVLPIYDEGGARLLDETSPLSIHGPEDCYKSDLILNPYSYIMPLGGRENWPRQTGGLSHFCTANLQVNTPNPVSLDPTIYQNERFTELVSVCEGSGNLTVLDRNGDSFQVCAGNGGSLTYRRIPSLTFHTSPTASEYGTQLTTLASPNLPIDRDRYMQFEGISGDVGTLYYPNFFRIETSEASTRSDLELVIKAHLDEVSDALNVLISQNDPDTLGARENQLLEILGNTTVSDYPQADVDLFAFIQQDPQTYELLLDALEWKNVGSVGEKYSYVIENYLGSDSDDIKTATAPDNKELYEIAYIGGIGGGSTMHIDIFPEKTEALPADLQDIQDQNEILDQFSLAVNGYGVFPEETLDESDNGSAGGEDVEETSSESDHEFACGPADGVIIWEWIPAIICWIEDLKNFKLRVPEIDTSEFDRFVDLLTQFFNDPSDSNVLEEIRTYQVDYDHEDDGSAEYYYENQGSFTISDDNQNGIYDEYEIEGTHILRLNNPREILPYSTNGRLSIELTDATGTTMEQDSFTRIILEVETIELEDELLGRRILKRSDYPSSEWDEITNEIIRIQSPTYLRRGEAQSLIGSKRRTAKVSIAAYVVDNQGETILSSERVNLSVQPIEFRVYAKTYNENSQSFEVSNQYPAGENHGISFDMALLGTSNATITDPVSLEIVDVRSGEPLLRNDDIEVFNGSYLFTYPEHADILNNAGRYRFVFEDSIGFQDDLIITVVPGEPSSLDLHHDNVFVKDTKYLLDVDIQDRFGNHIGRPEGELTIRTNLPVIIGDSEEGTEFSFDTAQKSLLPIIPLQSGDLTLALEYKNDNFEILGNSQVQIIDGIHARIIVPGDGVKVGGETYPLEIIFYDTLGNRLIHYDRETYARIDRRYGRILESDLVFENGVARTAIRTSNWATPHLEFSLDAPGIKQIDSSAVVIFPEDPISVHITQQGEDLASDGESTVTLRATLHDIYGNTAFNAGSQYRVDFDAQPEDIVSFVGEYENVVFSDGVSNPVVVQSSDFSGIVYVTATVKPTLETNTFTAADGSQDYTIEGVSQNLIVLQVHNALDAETISNINVNSLYNVLAGGDYANVSTADYLAGNVIFGSGVALAATSLADNPYIQNTLFEVLAYGGVRTFEDRQSRWLPLTQATITPSGNVAVDIIDENTSETISRVYYDFDPTATRLIACEGFEIRNGDCELPDSAYIFFKPENDVEFVQAATYIEVTLGGGVVARITQDGKVIGSNLTLEISPNEREAQSFALSYNGEYIGYIEMRMGSIVPGHVSDELLAVRGSGQAVLLSIAPGFKTRTHFGSASTHGPRSLVVQPQISTVPKTDSRVFGGGTKTGFERYLREDGIGWQRDNLTFLEFAASSPIGEVTRTNMSYLTLNVGDPLLTLDPIENYTHGYDRTLGEKIFEGTDHIDWFEFGDLNNDNKKDLVVFYENGTVDTLFDTGEKYVDLGELAHLEDVGRNGVGVGDFFGDGYSDIAYIDTDHELVILDNTDMEMERVRPVFESGDEPPSKIMHMKVFDMDADGIDDIVVMEYTGAIFILYGKQNRKFLVHLIDGEGGLEIDNVPSKQYFKGAVHYTGAGGTQIPTESIDLEALGINPDSDIDVQEQLIELLEQQESIPEEMGDIAVAQQAALLANLMYYVLTYQEELPSSVTNEFTAEQIAQVVNTSQQVNFPGSVGGDLNAQIAEGLAGLPPGSVTYLGFQNPDEVTVEIPFLKSSFINSGILDVRKGYELGEDEIIDVTITIQNTSSERIENLMLLDENPDIFSSDTRRVGVSYRGTNERISAQDDPSNGYDYWFDLTEFPLDPGEIITLEYEAIMSQFVYGELIVGKLEQDNDPLETRDIPPEEYTTKNTSLAADQSFPEDEFHDADDYGDIMFNPNKSCGGPFFLYRSHNTHDRTYQKVFKTYDQLEVEDSDEIQEVTDLAEQAASDDLDQGTFGEEAGNYASEAIEEYNEDSDGDDIPDRGDDLFETFVYADENGVHIQVASKFSDAIQSVTDSIEEFMKNLSCGFGDAGCIATPINWAVNAPGNTITVLGFPAPVNIPPVACKDSVLCGTPIFAFPTIPCESCSYSCTTWPPCPMGAGGLFDYVYGGAAAAAASTATSASPIPIGAMDGLGISQIRLWVSPTLTGAVGFVSCFGPNNPLGHVPPLGFWPMSGIVGNCVFAAARLIQCEDTGHDEPPELLGPEITEDIDSAVGGNGFINGKHCEYANPVLVPEEFGTLASAYASGDHSAGEELLTYMQENPSLASGGSGSPAGYNNNVGHELDYFTTNPFVQLGRGGGGSEIYLAIDLENLGEKKFGDVLAINMNRIAAFPAFLMDWVSRQIDEIVTSLTKLPRIIVVLPELDGVTDRQWGKTFGQLGQAYKDGKNKVNSDPNAGELPSQSGNTGTTNSKESSLGSKAVNTVGNIESGIKNSKLVTGARSQVSGMRNAFEFLSSLPLINFHEEVIHIQIPWFGKGELQDWLNRNQLILADWKAQATSLSSYVDANALIHSLERNIAIVRTYMEFPERLQEYLHWREKYLYEILANVEAIEAALGGWLYDNGVRFRAWVEVFVLLINIFDLWNIIIEIFQDYNTNCEECKNERWNLLHWYFILISWILPDIPVIEMPKWPDIELDLSDIDINLDIPYPVFQFSPYPIKLPDAPDLNLIGLRLPEIPLLPELPDLPPLPSLPIIQLPQLPDLPPPPKLPQLSGAIEVILDILDLVLTILCLYRKIPLSPEDNVGTKLAHKTERLGFLPFDFLDSRLPNWNIEWIDLIRVAAHVEYNYEVGSIVDAVEGALEPVTEFPENISRWNSYNSGTVEVDFNSVAQRRKNAIQDPIGALRDIAASMHEFAGTAGIERTPEETKKAIAYKLAALQARDDPKLAPLLAQVENILSYTGLQEQKIIEEAQRNRQEKFGAIALFIDEQIEENLAYSQEIQQILRTDEEFATSELFAHLAPTDEIPVSEVVNTYSSEELSHINDALFESFANVAESQDASASEEDPFAGAVLLAQNDNSDDAGSPIDSSDANLGDIVPEDPLAGQNFVFDSMYVLNSDGESQRLFDYTDRIVGDEQIMSFDRDLDGDQDVFYRLGRNIYLKRHQANEAPLTYIAEAPKVISQTEVYREYLGVSEDTFRTLIRKPYLLPVGLHEAGEVSTDYIDRDPNVDHIRVVAHQNILAQYLDPEDQGATLYIDLISNPDFITYYEDQQGFVSGYGALAYIDDANGIVRIDGPKLERTLLPNNRFVNHLSGEVQILEQNISLRRGTPIYTANQRTLIEYTTSGGNSERQALRPHSRYEFGGAVEVRVIRGAVMLFGSENETQWISDATTLKGLPIIPDMRVAAARGGNIDVEFYDNADLELGPEDVLLIKEMDDKLGKKDLNFEVRNGFYHAQMYAVGEAEEYKRTLNQQILFAPDDASDLIPIIARFPRQLRVPFNQTTQLDLSEYIIDNSPLGSSEIRGLPSSQIRKISETLYELGPFDSVISRTLIVRVSDEIGNTSEHRITLIPETSRIDIEDVVYLSGEARITGRILPRDPSLRAGIYEYIDEDTQKLLTQNLLSADELGNFAQNISFTDTDTDIIYEGEPIARVDEFTGNISNVESGYRVDILGANADHPTLFVLTDGTNTLYEQSYTIVDPVFAGIVSRTSINGNPGVYLISNSLNLVKNSGDTPLLPDGAYITDFGSTPILGISQDGQIYTLNDDYRIEYDSSVAGEMLINIYAGNNLEGELILKLDGVYVTREEQQ